jgi:hypothetical protein
MQRLQIELLRRLGRDRSHGRALHGLGDRLSVPEVVLVTLDERLDILGRHQPSIVTKCD